MRGDFFQDLSSRAGEDFAIFKMQNANSLRRGERDFTQIVPATFLRKMVRAVEFDCEFFFGTIKIENECAQAVLAPKTFSV